MSLTNLERFTTHYHQSIEINNKKVKQKFGVPQGGLLVPTLFFCKNLKQIIKTAYKYIKRTSVRKMQAKKKCLYSNNFFIYPSDTKKKTALTKNQDNVISSPEYMSIRCKFNSTNGLEFSIKKKMHSRIINSDIVK